MGMHAMSTAIGLDYALVYFKLLILKSNKKGNSESKLALSKLREYQNLISRESFCFFGSLTHTDTHNPPSSNNINELLENYNFHIFNRRILLANRNLQTVCLLFLVAIMQIL